MADGDYGQRTIAVAWASGRMIIHTAALLAATMLQWVLEALRV